MEEAAEKTELTVSALDELCITAFKLDEQYNEIAAKLKEINKETDQVHAKILAHFDETDKDKYVVKGYGTFYTHRRRTVTVPKGEDRVIFFTHLKDTGRFDELITVNSQTLNAYVEEERQNALNSGNPNFQVPGIKEATVTQSIRIRRG